jgi:hypothetical protein
MNANEIVSNEVERIFQRLTTRLPPDRPMSVLLDGAIKRG